ncbi:MAG TPA: MFS transporter [Desulfosporosinus sp.]|nr:MFS transporter [Desulfosporosinus sp.]
MTDNQTDQVTTKKMNPSLILLGLSLATLMTSIDTNIVAVGLPTIAKALNTNFSSVQWIVLSYLLSITTLIVGIGRIGDMFGKKWLYLSGIVIFTTASLLCGLSSSIYMLVAARVLQGIGGSILMALSFALVVDVVPKEKIPQAMGILTSMLTLGIALGPSLGGVLISAFGWHIIFLVNIPIGIVTFIIALNFPNLEVTHTEQHFDWLGVLALAISLICYNFGITFSESQGLSVNVLLLIIFSIISTAIFIIIEKNVSSPLINLKIFKDRIISGSLGISVIIYAMIMSIGMVLPFFLSDAQGLPTFEVGLLIAVGPLATTVMGPIAGKAAARFGNRPVMISGMIGFGIGCLLMTTLTPSSNPIGFAIRIAISNGSFAFFQTPNNAAIMASAKPEQRGVISGLLNLARTLGLTTGASLMGAVFAYFTMTAQGISPIEKEQYSVSSASPAAITSGIHGTFIVAVIAVVIAIIVGIITLRPQKEITQG